MNYLLWKSPNEPKAVLSNFDELWETCSFQTQEESTGARGLLAAYILMVKFYFGL